MRRIIATILVAGAFIAPAAVGTAPATAATSYSCTGNVLTNYNCQYANKYGCSGSTWWAYRFWNAIYDLNTGKVVSWYKETLVIRYTNGKPVQDFYADGWSYSPC